MEIILIVVGICAFVFFISTFSKMSKTPVKTESKDASKPNDANKDESVGEIPEILKEVTTGNYMYDLAQSSSNEVQFAENENISLDKDLKRTNVAKAFDDISDIGDDFDEAIDVEIEEINDIEDDMDDDLDENYSDAALLGDILEEESEQSNNEVAVEYSKLSKKMKAILMSNALNKKHHD